MKRTFLLFDPLSILSTRFVGGLFHVSICPPVLTCSCRYALLDLNLSFNRVPLTNLPSSFDRLLGREVAVRLLGTVAKDVPDAKQPTGHVTTSFLCF